MTESFKMPDPGEGIHEAEILEVYVEEGQSVQEGEPLFSIETDKAAIDIPAGFDGSIESIEVGDGDRVNVGDVLLTYTSGGKEAEEDAAAGSEQAQSQAQGQAQQQQSADDSGGTSRKAASSGGKQRGRSKKASRGGKQATTGGGRRREAESGEEKPGGAETSAEPESGEGDGKPRYRTEPAELGDEPRQKSQRQAAEASEQGPAAAAPSTRRLARELGVDLTALEGSGPEGRVLEADVRAAAGAEEAGGAGERESGRERPERIALRGVRRATAEAMRRSWAEIPQVTHEDLVDITALEELRRDAKRTVEEAGGRLTLTVLVIKALAGALRVFPRFNASLDADNNEIVFSEECHIGIATDTDDGLIVPVLRNVDRKSLLELAVEAYELSGRARRRDISRDELRGATFSITNPGSIGGLRFTPLINPPQAAILGLGRAQLVPTVRSGSGEHSVEPRLMLPLMLTFDHRLNDGADAARFVNHLVRSLGSPASFALHV